MKIKRREFLKQSAIGVGGIIAGAQLAGAAESGAAPAPAAPQFHDPFTLVPLGKSGLKFTRVCMGTGSHGGKRESNQTRKGRTAFQTLLRGAYDRGVRTFDLADLYGTHTYLPPALAGCPRDSYNLISNNGGNFIMAGGNNFFVGRSDINNLNVYSQTAGTGSVGTLQLGGMERNTTNQFLLSGGNFAVTNIGVGAVKLGGGYGPGSVETNVLNMLTVGGGNFTTYSICFGDTAYISNANSGNITNVVTLGNGTLGQGTVTFVGGGTNVGFFQGYGSGTYYTNQVIWNGGVLQAGTNSTTMLTNMGNTLVMVSNAGGIFDANGFNDTLSANITNNNGSGILTITNSAAAASTVTLSGTNAEGLVIQQGAGTLNMVFSGNETLAYSNNYTGTTTLGGSFLSIANANALGSGNIIASGGTLRLLTNLTLTNFINGAGSFNVAGTGTLSLAASGMLTNTLTVNGGTVTFTNAGTTNTIGGSGYLQVNSNGSVVIGNGATLNGYGSAATTAGYQYVGNIGSAGQTSSITILQGGTFNSDNIRIGGVNSGLTSILQNNGGIFTAQVNFPGVFLGRGGVGITNQFNEFLQNAGTSTNIASIGLMAQSGYSTNEVLVNGGLLALNAGGAITMGNAFGTTYAVTNVVNIFSNTGGQTIASFISLGGGNNTNASHGGITNNVFLGGGTLTVGYFTNGNSIAFTQYTNQIVWNGATLQANANSAGFLTNMPNTLVVIGGNGGIFDVNGYANGISANLSNLSGAGGLTVNNSSATNGLLILSGSNSYAGATLVNGGLLDFQTATALYGGNTNLWTTSNLIVNGTGGIAFGVTNFTAGQIQQFRNTYIGTAGQGIAAGEIGRAHV